MYLVRFTFLKLTRPVRGSLSARFCEIELGPRSFVPMGSGVQKRIQLPSSWRTQELAGREGESRSMQAQKFSGFSSFPLVTDGVKGPGARKQRSSRVSVAPVLGLAAHPKNIVGSRHAAGACPWATERKARQAAIEHNFQYKKPVPCLLPANPFIASSHRRDDDHLFRSQLGFAHAVARCTEEGRHELRMHTQPHVTLHYEEDRSIVQPQSEVHSYVRMSLRVVFDTFILSVSFGLSADTTMSCSFGISQKQIQFTSKERA